MSEQSLPTPPLGKLRIWEDDLEYGRENADVTLVCAWQEGFQAGADHQLKKDCQWLETNSLCYHEKLVPSLRNIMRPKPPSLKEQALQALIHLEDGAHHSMDTTEVVDIIRRALESLSEGV
jgi:hypothetical protein